MKKIIRIVINIITLILLCWVTITLSTPSFNKVKMKNKETGKMKTIDINKSLFKRNGKYLLLSFPSNNSPDKKVLKDNILFFNLSGENISYMCVVKRTQISAQFLLGPFKKVLK